MFKGVFTYSFVSQPTLIFEDVFSSKTSHGSLSQANARHMHIDKLALQLG